MNSVNSCSMPLNSDASDIVLDKIKNILVSFEKKKRNLEKRKNKLDEYKKKSNLNDDQQAAVAKYPEVLSNLDLLEELTTYTVQQLKDAEKCIKKVKKQEKIEKKRCESHLIEFILMNYSILDRIGSSERLRRKLTYEGILNEHQLNIIMDLVSKLNLCSKGDWKTCAEQMYTLYESVNINTDEKKVNFEELLSSINNLVKVDWLWASDGLDSPSNFEQIEPHNETSFTDDNVQSEPVHIQEERIVQQEPISSSVQPASDTSKLGFTFLHDSTVPSDQSMMVADSEYIKLGTEPAVNANSQVSVINLNNSWQMESDTHFENVNDVFSSATQSEFMRSELAKNAWAKRIKMPTDSTFRSHANAPQQFINENELSDSNYRRVDRNDIMSNAKVGRSTRGKC